MASNGRLKPPLRFMYWRYFRFSTSWTVPWRGSSFPWTCCPLVVVKPANPIIFIISASSSVLPSKSASVTNAWFPEDFSGPPDLDRLLDRDLLFFSRLNDLLLRLVSLFVLSRSRSRSRSFSLGFSGLSPLSRAVFPRSLSRSRRILSRERDLSRSLSLDLERGLRRGAGGLSFLPMVDLNNRNTNHPLLNNFKKMNWLQYLRICWQRYAIRINPSTKLKQNNKQSSPSIGRRPSYCLY